MGINEKVCLTSCLIAFLTITFIRVTQDIEFNFLMASVAAIFCLSFLTAIITALVIIWKIK